MFLNFLMNFFKQKRKKTSFLGVQKVKNNFAKWATNIKNKKFIDVSWLDELEILLIKADVGIQTTNALISRIKMTMKKNKIDQSTELLILIKQEILSFYHANDICENINAKKEMSHTIQQTPKIYLFVGVNGVGKTTTIAKLAAQLQKKGKKVLLVAGDTFRAGAIEQLKVWGTQIQSEVFFNYNTTNPSSLIFNALKYAKNKSFDFILCDTSGRLQNKVNLMQELEKIKRVITKQDPQAPHETFLILDAMTGQNGLNQIELFQQRITITGVIFTKIDGAAQGGLILSVKYLYNLATKYLGIGENPEDLIAFDIKNYVNNLFDDSGKSNAENFTNE
ncbi:signal recognition particle-docking protein FtsY [Candidatus Phytoplasma melaleucae]|uniref:signal recognition particle-docking protein FtsY n=1 Tax=Candidatus Phytoplasma melaleucae TaxID=2982630 RepID=UPI003CD0BB93